MSLKEKIISLAHEYLIDIQEIRRYINSHPEESFKEFGTALFIERKLDEWGISHKRVAETGIIAVIKGNSPEQRRVALRADMDAIFVEGKLMHACGHDAHTAMLLGVAKIINSLKDNLKGTFICIFQPGEEKVPGGAKLMIENNVVDTADFVIGQHVFPDLECGQIGIPSGVCMASCDELNVKVTAQGGHAAKIHQRKNTVLAASVFVSRLADEFPEKDDAPIVAFGRFIADGTYNAIPSEVNIKGTMRTFDENQRKEIKLKINEVAKDVANLYGVDVNVVIDSGYPSLKNDSRLEKIVTAAAIDLVGKDNVVAVEKMYTAEDFAWYSHQKPSFFYRLGCANVAKGIIGKQHTKEFNIDENCLEIGMEMMCLTAVSENNN